MVRYGTLKANAGRVGTHNIFELEQLERERKKIRKEWRHRI